jgi:hypothetical protein
VTSVPGELAAPIDEVESAAARSHPVWMSVLPTVLGFALVAYGGYVVGGGNLWITIPLALAGASLIDWVRARQGPRLRFSVVVVGGCFVLAAHGVEWLRDGRSALGAAAVLISAAVALMVQRSLNSVRHLTTRLIDLSESRRRNRGRLTAMGPLFLSPKLDGIIKRGRAAQRTGDQRAVDRTIKKLLYGHIGFANDDDVPGCMVYAAEFLSTRDEPGDLEPAIALSDECAWWMRSRTSIMIELQVLRADLQARRYRNTGDPEALANAVVMQSDAVELAGPPREAAEPHAETLVTLLLKHHRIFATTDSLDRAEQLCHQYPAIGERHLAEIQAARGSDPG